MKIINNFRQKIKQNPVSSTLIIILILVVITLGVPYIQNDDKSKANEDLIIGRRFKRKDQFIRLIITQIMKSIIFIRHGVVIKDSNSPFRLIKSEFLLKNLSKIDDSIIPNVLLSIIAAKNKKLKFIDVKHKERQTGEVSIKKWKLFSFCLKSLKEIICVK